MNNKVIIIINKTYDTELKYSSDKPFWPHYPDDLRREVVEKILERNKKGESVMSICKDLCNKYTRSPNTLAAWYRKFS